jgi:hypothetical protein
LKNPNLKKNKFGTKFRVYKLFSFTLLNPNLVHKKGMSEVYMMMKYFLTLFLLFFFPFLTSCKREKERERERVFRADVLCISVHIAQKKQLNNKKLTTKMTIFLQVQRRYCVSVN